MEQREDHQEILHCIAIKYLKQMVLNDTFAPKTLYFTQ